MLRKLFVLMFVLSASSVAAQSFRVEVGGGLAKHFGPSRVVGAYKVGIGYEYEFNQQLTLLPRLLFSAKGWKNPDEAVEILTPEGLPAYDAETGQPLMGVKNTSTTAYYIQLPVTLNYYIRTGRQQYVVLGAGPYLACGVGGKRIVKGDNEVQGAQRFYHSEQTFKIHGMRRFDAGLQVSAGYQFANGLTATIEADCGLVPVQGGSERNVSAMLSFAYTFR